MNGFQQFQQSKMFTGKGAMDWYLQSQLQRKWILPRQPSKAKSQQHLMRTYQKRKNTEYAPASLRLCLQRRNIQLLTQRKFTQTSLEFFDFLTPIRMGRSPFASLVCSTASHANLNTQCGSL